MRWRRLGIVWRPEGNVGWARSHAMGPTPVLLNPGIIRVYVTTLDSEGRGRPTYIDVSTKDPRRLLGVSPRPLLDIGEPGSFDDNGLMATCLVQNDDGSLFMYYAGFELCSHIRYRIFSGLAISRDGGDTFIRHSRAPILDRTDGELFFRCGPFVMRDGGVYKLWYIAGSRWIQIQGKQMPVYEMRYQESKDGIHWGSEGRSAMALSGGDEHGFGRPWVIKRGANDFQLFYSIRRRSLGAYRLGYAESKDGINWVRMDEDLNLDVMPGGFDSDAIMYSSIIAAGEKVYCFYNGNNFGEAGFGVAELIG